MPIRHINFTGRKRLISEDVVITLNNEATPLTFEISHLALESYALPADAIVRVEAYRQAVPVYAPFKLGTVADFTFPGSVPLPDFDSPDGVRFRVKVTAVSEPIEGQLLAEGDAIRPVWASGEQESLLTVRPSANLEQEVFRLDFDDAPVLLINERTGQWREVARDPVFVSLVYPAVLRTILTHILSDGVPEDEYESDDWRALWLRFAKGHTGVSNPPETPEDNQDWIEEVVKAFCKRSEIYTNFAKHWNSEDIL